MTLDEAIKGMETVAEENQKVVDTHIVFDDVTIDMLYCDDTEVIEEHLASCQGCAEEHRQLAEWLKELKQLREQTKWISVSERLPEDDKDVLVCFEQGGMAVAYYHIDNTYYPTQFEDMNETGWFNEEGDAFYSEPIAWMPLPEHYKVESEVTNADSN